MLELKLTDFKEGGTVPTLYAKSGVGAIKHGENTLTNQITKIGTTVTSPLNSGVYNIGDCQLRSFESYNGELYAIGRSPSSSLGALFKFDTSAAKWNQVGSDSTLSTNGGLTYYNGYFYGYQNGYMFRVTHTGVWTDSWNSIPSFTTTAKPIVHFGGKTLYAFSDNKVHQLRDSSFTSSVITFQDGFVITCAAEYGNYLIICGYESKTNHATASLWDRDSSLARITNVLDLGVGIPKHVAVLDGTPTVTMNDAGASRLQIRQFSSQEAVTKVLYEHPSASMLLGGESYTEDNKLYFPFSGTLRDDDTDAASYIMSVDSLGRVIHTAMNTDVDSTHALAVTKHDGRYFSCYTSDLGTFMTSKTSFTQPTILETRLLLSDNPSNHIQTQALTVYTTPLPSGAIVTFKGRINEASSWTTLGTSDTDVETRHTLTQAAIRNYGADFGIGRVLQVRIEVTGNANITGVTGRFAEVNKEPYE